MRPLVLMIALALLPVVLVAQTSKQMEAPVSVISNVQRHKIDFEIKDQPSPSATLLNNIDLSQYEMYRSDSEDVEVYDPVNNVTIILYSTFKALDRKKHAKPQTGTYETTE